mgnify:CR=1 FL=1
MRRSKSQKKLDNSHSESESQIKSKGTISEHDAEYETRRRIDSKKTSIILSNFISQPPSDDEDGSRRSGGVSTNAFLEEHEQNRFGFSRQKSLTSGVQNITRNNMKKATKSTGNNLMGLFRAKQVPSEEAVLTRGQELWRKMSMKHRVFGKLLNLNRQINNEIYGMDDRNLDEEVVQKNFYSIDPKNRLKRCWDVVVIIYTVYLALIYTFIIAFVDTISKGVLIINLGMSSVFLVDLILNFFTAYHDEDEIAIRDLPSIMLHYLRTWFFPDLLSAIPFFAFPLFSEQNAQIGDYRYVLLIPLVKVFKSMTIFLQKDWVGLFKVFKDTGTYVMRMIKIILLAVYLVHLSVCIFMITARTNLDIATTWVYRLQPEMVSLFELYIVGVYWSVQTLATVGFGDIQLVTNSERLFGIVWLAFGSAFYSFLISNLQSVVEQADADRKDLKSKIAAVMKFATETDLPDDIIQKLKKYMESHKNHTQASTEDINIIDELPYTLKAQILVSMNAKIVDKLPFFENKNVDLILRIVPQLKPLSLSTNEILYREGDHTEEVFFLSSGFINFKASNGIIFHTVSDGAIFGEVEAILNVVRIGTAQAAVPTKLFSLEKKLFHEMIKDFPEVGQQLTRNNITTRAEMLRNKNRVLKIKGQLESKVITGTAAHTYAVDTTQLSKNLLSNPLEKGKTELKEKIKRGVGKMIKQQLLNANKTETNPSQPSTQLDPAQSLKKKSEDQSKQISHPQREEKKKSVTQLIKIRKNLLTEEASPKNSPKAQELSNESEINTSEGDLQKMMLEMYNNFVKNIDSFSDTFEAHQNEIQHSIDKLEYKCNVVDELLYSVKEISRKQEEMESYLTGLLINQQNDS